MRDREPRSEGVWGVVGGRQASVGCRRCDGSKQALAPTAGLARFWQQVLARRGRHGPRTTAEGSVLAGQRLRAVLGAASKSKSKSNTSDDYARDRTQVYSTFGCGAVKPPLQHTQLP